MRALYTRRVETWSVLLLATVLSPELAAEIDSSYAGTRRGAGSSKKLIFDEMIPEIDGVKKELARIPVMLHTNLTGASQPILVKAVTQEEVREALRILAAETTDLMERLNEIAAAKRQKELPEMHLDAPPNFNDVGSVSVSDRSGQGRRSIQLSSPPALK